MTNTIVSEILTVLENQRSFIQNLEKLNDEQINWIPNGSKNSIGILMDHLIGAEKSLIHQTIFGIEITRNRDKEFEQKARSIKDLLKIYDSTSHESKSLLSSKLSDKDLLEERTRRGSKNTVLWYLLHTVEHNNYHIGQINLIIAMLNAL